MTSLGTLEELPLDYRKTIEAERLAPLWPMLRDVLPHDAPKPITKPCLWAYQRGARGICRFCGRATC